MFQAVVQDNMKYSFEVRNMFKHANNEPDTQLIRSEILLLLKFIEQKIKDEVVLGFLSSPVKPLLIEDEL